MNATSKPTLPTPLMRGAFITTLALLLTSQIAQAQPEEGRYYRIQNANSKLVLGVAGKTELGTEVIQVPLNKSAEGQQWKFVKKGNVYEIINKKSGKALNVRDGSKSENAPLIQWNARSKGENQRWSLEKNGDSFSLIAQHSGMAIGILNRSKEPGIQVVQLRTRKNAKNQLFDLVPIE